MKMVDLMGKYKGGGTTKWFPKRIYTGNNGLVLVELFTPRQQPRVPSLALQLGWLRKQPLAASDLLADIRTGMSGTEPTQPSYSGRF